MATTDADQATTTTRQAVTNTDPAVTNRSNIDLAVTNTNPDANNTNPAANNTNPAANNTNPAVTNTNPAATKGNPAGTLSSDSNMTSLTTSPPAPSRPSLLGIEPELRLAIYAYAFAAPPGPIDLTQAVAPSKALLLTCHQIRNEAAQLYRTAYRDFWEKGTFKVDVRGCCLETATEQVYMQIEEDLAHMTKMHVLTGPGVWVWNGWSGLWTRWNDDYPTGSLRIGIEELWVPVSMFYDALDLLQYLMPLDISHHMDGVMAVQTEGHRGE